MRITIELDDELLEDAVRLSGGMSRKAMVEAALTDFLGKKRREALLARIGSEDSGIDLTPEELRRMRGCDDPPLVD